MALKSFDKRYLDQLNLVLQILPVIEREGTFVLKGGTAINLFERGLPRLSVDIDLCYPRFSDRELALKEIVIALDAIRDTLTKQLPDIKIVGDKTHSLEYKLLCRTPLATVKIEVNTTMRGNAFPLRVMPIHRQTQDILEQYVEMRIVSKEELYGGKICAALDRQHPRDLFDVKLLLSEGGLTQPIVQGFLVCLMSHNRPIHELLSPNRLDMQDTFDSQFVGMTNEPFSYQEYVNTRESLISTILKSLSKADREFLISFKSGTPDWNLFANSSAQKLPAVLWKLQNISKLRETSPEKYKNQLAKLKEALNIL